MILSNIKGITIPEGVVKQITSGGVLLWKKAPSSIVPGLAISYSGDYTDQADVVMGDGKTYRLLTLTGSGTLTLDQSVKADVWLCAGGNGGRSGGYHGGGGGKIVQSDDLQLAESTVCTIGVGSSAATSGSNGIGGTTTFGSLSAAQTTGSYKSASGASGGGGGAGGQTSSTSNNPGTGNGVSTVPCLDTQIFEPHSAGGGGGGWKDLEAGSSRNGGAGGSDGADGAKRASTVGSVGSGGVAGEKGGGAGGRKRLVRQGRRRLPGRDLRPHPL